MKNKIYSKLIILLALVFCLAACDGAVHLPEFSSTLYEITFDPNGGSGNMGVQTVKANRLTALLANLYIRNGYTFNGWNTKADGTGTSYTNEEKISVTDDLTLYAMWEGNTYSITYKFSHNLDANYSSLTGILTFEDYDGYSPTKYSDLAGYTQYSEYFIPGSTYSTSYVCGIGTELPNGSILYKDSIIQNGGGGYGGTTYDFSFRGWSTNKDSYVPKATITDSDYDNITLWAFFDQNEPGK